MCITGSQDQHTSVACTSNYARSGAYCEKIVQLVLVLSEMTHLLCNANSSVYILYLHGYPDPPSLTLSFLAGIPELKAAFALGSFYSQSSEGGSVLQQAESLKVGCSPLLLHWLGTKPQAGLASLWCSCPNQPTLPVRVGWGDLCRMWKAYPCSSGVTWLLA